MELILSLLDPSERELLAETESLCREKLLPLERAAGESSIVRREIVEALAESGLLDWTVPGPFGTRQGRAPESLSLVAFCLIRETLARLAPNAELIFTMQGLGAGPITFFGAPAQQQKHLPRVASGEVVCAFALTEPETGSDVHALTTEARREGEDYVLDGEKTLISMAPDADLYTVFAKTGLGLSAFIVEKGTAGFDPGERLELLAPHPLGAPRFERCRIPSSQRLGEEGEGFKIAMTTLDFFRTTVGAGAVGLAQSALDESIAFAKRRRAFGKTISEFQAIQLKLAAMATELAAARALVYRAAILRDRQLKPRVSLESAQAKLFATEAAQRIIDQAVQIHGGQGVLKGVTVERLYREIRALRIYEGTSEIQHLVIARELLR